MPSKAFEYLNSQNKINEAETKTTILEQIPVEPKNDFEKKIKSALKRQRTTLATITKISYLTK